MKNLLIGACIIASTFSSIAIYAQNETLAKKPQWFENGQVFGLVFANFHTASTDFGTANVIAVDRAYFGYKTKIDEHFSAAVKLDVGNPVDEGDVELKRYMFLKDAYLQYKIGKLTVKAGLAGTFQFKTSEKFWGHRYIYKAFQDASKMGSSADIGVFTSYKANDMITLDYAVMNGEGYAKIQNDSVFKHALGLTIKPMDILTLRAYTDLYDVADSTRQLTASFFAGLKIDKLTLGAEYAYQMNNKNVYENHFSGISISANYKLNDRFSVFGRYDNLSSKEIELATTDATTGAITTEMVAWNKKKDGSFMVGGIEFTPAQKINLALNYQHKIHANTDAEGWVYLNLQFAF